MRRDSDNGNFVKNSLIRWFLELYLQGRDSTGCSANLASTPSACDLFIGYHRVPGGQFVWIDTTPGAGTYENWADGEPNGPSDQMVCTRMLDNGEWNDVSCNDPRLAVCEKPAKAAPAGVPADE